MEAAGINLIPELTEKEVKEGVYRRKLNLAAIGALGAVGLIIFGLISYRGVLFLQANNIQNRSDNAERRIVELRDVELSLLALKEKLKQIEKILNESLPGSEAIAQVVESTGTSTPIIIRSLNLAETGEVLVEGTAESSEVFAEWIDKLTAQEKSKIFQRINLVSLIRDEDGYSFSLRFNFAKRGIDLTQ